VGVKFAWVLGLGLASVVVFLYNRTNATGKPKPGDSQITTPTGAKDHPGGAASDAAFFPDPSQPYIGQAYSQPPGSSTTFSDLGTSAAPDGSSPTTTAAPTTTFAPTYGGAYVAAAAAYQAANPGAPVYIHSPGQTESVAAPIAPTSPGGGIAKAI
jgi:hypothetical protein